MKKLFLLFTLIIVTRLHTTAQCNVGSYTVSGNTMITGSCTVTGDLTLLDGSTLNVDFTGASADTFVVRGNITLQGSAVLWIHSSAGATNDQFIVSNSYNNQRTITTNDSSRIQLENIEFRTQEGNLTNASSFYMNYDALGSSILYIDKCRLDTEKAWLLLNIKNRSTFIAYEPNHIPTEVYVQDTAQVSLHGANTQLGLWLNLEAVTGTLNLPADQTQPYSWKVGRGMGGLNTQWYLEIDTAHPGLGVQIFPSAQITVNGAGFPATGELKVALMFANNTDTIKDLRAGLQNTTVANGPNGSVTLNNVNLGPIAWQLYALMNEHLFVKNSVVNEIGIAGPSDVTVDSSLLQLAVLASVGVGGSSMTINNSEIWNQTITAANNSSLVLNNCSVTGSMFSTDAQSDITVNGGCFYANPGGCTQNTMIDIATGQPHCNPFIPAGFPQNLSPATVTFNGVNSNCISAIAETEISNGLKVYPNPAQNILTIELPEQNFDVGVFDFMGRVVFDKKGLAGLAKVDCSNFVAGVYLIKASDGEAVLMDRFVKE